jgi:hypothetical protein
MKSLVSIGLIFLAANLFAVRAQDSNAAPAQDTNAAPAPTAVSNSATAVQVDVSKVLNARVVTTLSNGQLVPLQIDIDGAGGVATAGAVTAMGSDNPHSVPDDGKFPANGDHPDIVLNFSNADGTGNQVRRSPKEDEYSFDVPNKNYSRMQLFFTSGAAGPAPLTITLTYQDGTNDVRNVICPDWWTNLDGTQKDCVYVASNLAKWGKSNKTLEKDHHNIFALDVHPDPAKVLTEIKVHKTRPLVCFWGATGVPAN